MAALLLSCILLLYSLASLLALILPIRSGHRVSCVLSLVSSILLAVAGARALAGVTEEASVFHGVFTLKLTVTPLSGLFALLFGVVFTLVSAYSISYIENEYGRHSGACIRLHSICYPIFLASMALILFVRSGLWLLVFWELMSLSSYLLVSFEHWREDVRDAGLVYFIMSHIAAALLIIVVVRLGTIGGNISFDYGVMSTRASLLGRGELICLSVLFALAMAIKGGLVPVHFWLPRAHPAAPSNVSALLSGIMIKVPVFLLLVFSLNILGVTLPLGVLVAGLGMLSMIVGAFYALAQRDDKVLLAYCSVEQVGYIWFAIGAGMIVYAVSKTMLPLALLLVAAGLFHTVNHALFKSMLFMITGNILLKTGTRDMDSLGGLEKLMPLTALAALIGCLSLTGLPPLNGFASKWMIYVLGLSTPALSSFNAVVYVGVALAVFASSITAVFAIKFYTSIFTGKPRRRIEAGEAPKLIVAPEILIAAACVVIGILPGLVLRPIFNAVGSLTPHVSSSVLAGSVKMYSFIMVPPAMPVSRVFFLLLAVLLPVSASIIMVLSRTKVFRGERVWLGGYEQAEEQCRVPSSQLYAVIQELMNGFYTIRVRRPSIHYREPRGDTIIVDPWVKLGRILGEIRRLQAGPVQLYLIVMLIVLIASLIAGCGR